MLWSDLCDRVVVDLGRASWQAAILAAFVILLRWLMGRRLSPAWRCGLWMLVAARLLLPVAPVSSWSLFNLVPPPVVSEPVQLPAVTIVIHTVAPEPIPSEQPAGINWNILLVSAWLAVAAILALRLILVNWRFARRVARTGAPAPLEIAQLIDDCARKMNLPAPRVRVTSAVATPALFGWRNATLLLPADFAQRVSIAEARLVVEHELTHLRRRDIAAGSLAAGLTILHWFNPLVWIAAACWRADIEAACDTAVIATMDENHRADYGLLLMKLAARLTPCAPRPAVGMIDGKRELKRRIIAIARFDRPAARWSIAGALLLLAVVLIGLTDARGASTTQPQLTPPPTPAPAETGQFTQVFDIRDLLAGVPEKFFLTDHPDSALVNHTDSGTPSNPAAIRNNLERDLRNLLADRGVTSRVYFTFNDRTGQMIVTGPPSALADVTDYLNYLRQKRNVLVTISIHFITPDTAVATGDINLSGPDQVNRLVQAAERNPHVSIISAPRITVYDGESAELSVGSSSQYVEKLNPILTTQPAALAAAKRDGFKYAGYTAVTGTVESGIKVTAKPKVSDDRKFVTIDMKATVTDLLGFDKASVPDDPKVIFQVPKEIIHEMTAKVNIADGQSVLMKAPVVRNDGDPAQNMLVIVTANILQQRAQ